jgi:hypothetical protein
MARQKASVEQIFAVFVIFSLEMSVVSPAVGLFDRFYKWLKLCSVLNFYEFLQCDSSSVRFYSQVETQAENAESA